MKTKYQPIEESGLPASSKQSFCEIGDPTKGMLDLSGHFRTQKGSGLIE